MNTGATIPRVLLFCLTVVFLVSTSCGLDFAHADESSTATFLKLDPSARSAAVGSSYVARGSSHLGSYFNPASLSGLRNQEAQYTNMDLFAGIGYQYLSYTHPIDERSAGFGVNLTTLDYGTQQRTQINNNDPITGLGNFGAEDLSLSTSYGQQLSGSLDGGVALKYVQSDIAGFNDGTLSGDLGLHYESLIKGLELGIAARNIFGNIGLNQRSDPLPRQLEGGLYYKEQLDGSRHVFHFGATGTVTNDGSDYTSFGLEYEYYKRGFLRIGHRGLQDADDGFTFGLGIHFNGIKIDYAFVPFGELGDQQRFSVAYEFGEPDQSGEPKRKSKDSEEGSSPDRSESYETDKKPQKTDFSGSRKRKSNPKRKSSQPEDRNYGLPSVREAVSDYNTGNYSKAHKILSEILEIRPEHVKALLWIGKIEYEIGAKQEAIKRFKKVLEIEPGNRAAKRNLEMIQNLSDSKGSNQSFSENQKTPENKKNKER